MRRNAKEAPLVEGHIAGRSSTLIILHGAESLTRRDVARRLHRHGDFSSGRFVEARLSAVPYTWREKALFGPVEVDFSSILSPIMPSDIRREADETQISWVEAASGGTLFIDEMDCLCPVLQKRLILLQRGQNGSCSSDVRSSVIIGSQYGLALLQRSGGLIPEFSAWLEELPATCRLGPERLYAVWNLPEQRLPEGALPEGSSSGGRRMQAANKDLVRNSVNNDVKECAVGAKQGVQAVGPVSSSRLPGLAAALEPLLQTYVALGLESGGKGLYATVLGEVERPLISLVLHYTGGNQLRAAALLGVNRNTLRKRMKELQIAISRK